MVLYKRKQVKIIPPDDLPEDLTTQVWFIPETKEWFLLYSDYIKRMDYLKTRNFVCEITGNSCLTYFEALKSEEQEIREVEKNFPEALKEHILRFLQFNRISRLDMLVDNVYQVFKNDYFPGETVFLRGIDNNNNVSNNSTNNKEHSTKQRGTIREKVQYGQDQPTKYLVVRLNDNHQAIVTEQNISRDRNHFTKWLIKTFIKLTMSRSYKVGAPWVVKTKYAKKYSIPTTYPDDLKQFADTTPTGDIVFIQPKKKRGPQPKIIETPPKPPKPPKEPKKSKKIAIKAERKQPTPAPTKPIVPIAPAAPPAVVVPFKKKFPTHYIPDAIMKEYEEEEAKGTPSFGLSQFQPTKKNIVEDLELKFDLQNSKPLPKILSLPENAKYWNQQIIEEEKEKEKETEGEIDEIERERERLSCYRLPSILEALQSWIFLNVYHNILNIDTFTFDDFVFAMGWNADQFSEDGRCELLDEIWCAVLSAIVSNELPTNKEAKDYKERDEIYGLTITLPEKDEINEDSENDSEEDEDEDEKEEDEKIKQEKQPQQDEKQNNIKDNESNSDQVSSSKPKGDDSEDHGSESELEEKQLDIDTEQSDSEENDKESNTDKPVVTHNAYECMNHRGTSWDERLRKRNFKDGNWQCILLGVLSLVEHVPQYETTINKIYHKLAPKDKPATALSVRNQFYDELDIELKFKALNILIDLVISSPLVRNHIDSCLENLTLLRRNRLDNLKEYKIVLELAQKAHQYITTKLATTKNVSQLDQSSPEQQQQSQQQQPQQPQQTEQISEIKKGLDLNKLELSESERLLAEQDNEFKEQCNIRKDAIIKLNQLKEAKREIEQKLTELDCQRMKLLGKDRLYNRYWWFENNGLPNLHSGGNNNDEDEDDDENNDNNKKDEGENENENENEDKGENVDSDNENEEEVDDDVHDETYLMGRLWVQGPSNNDIAIHFKTDLKDAQEFLNKIDKIRLENDGQELDNGKVNEENNNNTTTTNSNTNNNSNSNSSSSNNNKVKKLNFSKLPSQLITTVRDSFALDIKEKEIFTQSGEKLIDEEGSFMVPLAKLSNLQRKCIEEFPDPLMTGLDWRYYDKPEDITKLISWLNPWGKRESLLRKELSLVKEAIISSMEARRKALWIDQTPPEELEISDNIKKLKTKLFGGSGDDNENENHLKDKTDAAEEDDDVILTSSAKRARRSTGSRKRQKVVTVQDALEFGEPEDVNKMIKELEKELIEKKDNREINRVLEWVNSRALDLFEKSLYEGGDKQKSNKSKQKKK